MSLIHAAPSQERKTPADLHHGLAGNWQAGAAIYRQWAEARFGLVPLEQKGPAWAREIRFVVIMLWTSPY